MNKAPGFFSGAASLPRALDDLRKAPGLWPSALVPSLVFLVLFSLGLLAAGQWLVPPLLSWTGLEASTSWYGRASELAVSGAAWVISILLSVWASLVLTPPVSSPALEHLITAQEQQLNAPPRAPQSWLAEFWCGLRAQAFALVCVTPVLLLLWVVGLAVPALGLVLLPFKVALMASALAWNLLDYPLTLRGVAMRDRWRILRKHPQPVLGFGLVFTALFWLPCANVLLLPVGAMAATRLVWALLRAEPALLPSLLAETTVTDPAAARTEG